MLPLTDKDYKILSLSFSFSPLCFFIFIFLFVPFGVYICVQDAMEGKSLRLHYDYITFLFKFLQCMLSIVMIIIYQAFIYKRVKNYNKCLRKM